MRGLFGAVVLSASLSGCYNLKYYDSTVPGPGQSHKVWVHSFVAGLVTAGELDFAAECPKGVYKMQSNHSPVVVLLTVVTVGIYSPVNIVLTCGTGPDPT